MGSNISADEKTRVEIRSIEEAIKRDNALAAETIKRENALAAERARAIDETIKRENALAEQTTIQNVTVAVLVAAIALLTLDYAANGFRPFLKMRLKWSLKRAPPRLNSSKLLPYDDSRSSFVNHVKFMNLPTLLVGPTGCGKV